MVLIGDWLLVQSVAHDLSSGFVGTVETSFTELVLNRAHRFVLADAEGNAKPVRKPRLNFPPYLFGQVVVVCHTSTVVMAADI